MKNMILRRISSFVLRFTVQWAGFRDHLGPSIIDVKHLEDGLSLTLK